MKPYYYVYHYGDKAPRVRHATLEQAEKEAKRILTITPGATLEILQCVGLTKMVNPHTFWLDGCFPTHFNN